MFDTVTDPIIEKISHAHFRIIEDLGEIKINNHKYAINQIDFYTRSIHRIGGESMPLEMIASAELVELTMADKDKLETDR